MSRIFDADNAFFRFMSKVADALILNLFFLITSIPLVTIGASYTALYYYCTKAVGKEEGYLWRSYWKSFKLNFIQGFLMEAIFAVIALILYLDLKYLYDMAFNGGAFGWRLLFFIVVGMAVLALVTFLYAFPLLSRFDNKTMQIIKNAAFMSIKHLSTTVPLILIFLVFALIAYLLFPLSIFFVVGAWVYISSILLYKVIDRYIPKDERYEEDYYLGAAPEDAAAAAGVVNMDTVNAGIQHINEAVNGAEVQEQSREEEAAPEDGAVSADGTEE